MKNLFRIAATALTTAAVSLSHAAIEIESATFGGLQARNIGPAVMSGRIASIDAVQLPNEPLTIFVGTASGGVWKSIDGGIVYQPVFDEHTQSIGAVRIDPSNPETIWVGTGESAVRNTVSVGDGVYRSTDGGDSWTHLGLTTSERIAELLVHPENSDTVFVCALGPLWSSGGERGVYKTSDGGQTWTQILAVNEQTGCADLAMTPDGNTLYAGMWEVRRYPDFFESGGEGSNLYRSTDGGASWEILASGLPDGLKGRIDVAVAASKPEWVYAAVESESTALYRSEDSGDNWQRMDDSLNIQFRPFYFGELVVDPTDHMRVYVPAFSTTVSTDGGDTFSGMFGSGFSISVHPDHHALWINPDNPEQVLLGTDGGVYISADRGFHWRHVANLPVSQFYHVASDRRWPYNIYGGLQDNGSWMGPSRAPGGIRNKHWQNIGFGDGFWSMPDRQDDNIIYSEYQGGQLKRVNRQTLEIKRIQPVAGEGEEKLRFNWNTPLHLSQGRRGAIYYGSQYLHRSHDQGDSWETISPDLTTDDPEGQRQDETGGITLDNSTAENYTTIYTISESPLDDDIIWVGTDDGNVQLTRNSGRRWTNVVANIPDIPERAWVSRLEASPHDKASAYVTFDDHRRGDMNTYVFKTEDYGQTWRRLITPDNAGYAWVIRQDLVNPELLFLGTEFGLYVSLDDGDNWARFTENLPMVAVHDIDIHPTEHDVILGTHGRGVYIIDDITPLRGITQSVIDTSVSLLPTRDAAMVLNTQLQNFGAHDDFVAPNPSASATIVYYLQKRHLFGDLKVEVFDAEDRLITTLPGGKRRGLNRVEWPMRFKAPKFPASTSLVPGFLGPRVPEGEYRVVLTKGKETIEGSVRLVADPRTPHSARDRQLQQSLALDLYDMINDLTFLSERLEAASEQASDRAESLSAHSDTLNDFVAATDTLRTSLSASRAGAAITGEEKLRERLGTVYGNVVAYDGRPSETQIERRDQLLVELQQAKRDSDQLLDERLATINALLVDNDLAPIELQSRDDWNEEAGMSGFTGAVHKHFFRHHLPAAIDAMMF